jgi:hypothetical protein
MICLKYLLLAVWLWAIGISILYLLPPLTYSKLSKHALAIILGVAVAPLMAFYANKLGFPFREPTLIGIAAVLAGTATLKAVIHKKSVASETGAAAPAEKLRVHEWLAVIAPALIVLVVGVFYYAHTYYQWAWDPFTGWQSRGFAWSLQGGIGYIAD